MFRGQGDGEDTELGRGGATARSGRGKTKEGDLLGREGWGVVHCADGAERSGERHGELTPLGLGDDR